MPGSDVSSEHAEEPAWQPSPRRIAEANISRFLRWLKTERQLNFDSYARLLAWSTDDLPAFWSAIWDYFDVDGDRGLGEVLQDRGMLDARWFPGARLNYVDQVFRFASATRPAIVFGDESGAIGELSYADLRQQAGALAHTLARSGVGPGDRVAAYMPNVPETIVAFLATASLGAIWSLVSPDMGLSAVLDRFRQIEPKVLIATDAYRWGGKLFDRREVVRDLRAGLPTVKQLIVRPHAGGPTEAADLPEHLTWQEALQEPAPLEPIKAPFDHPLWIIYSSGTTGLPKGIVHGHGGVLLEHLKYLGLHNDLGVGDRFHWYGSTGWMVWNLQASGLLVGATACIFDGSPNYPDNLALWRFAEASQATYFAAGSAFFIACQKSGLSPRAHVDLSRIKSVQGAGSPLSADCYHWIYEHVGSEVFLCPSSGGTDIASAFVGGVPILPVFAGEMQAACLGARIEAYDDQGNSVIDQVGELVCTRPMPSMPLFFWNDRDKRKYSEAYFQTFEGVWRHGDWLRITPRGGAVIYGRSDATINRNGVRAGTSEIYRVVEATPEILDSLVVDLEYLGRQPFLALFVELAPGAELTEELKSRINADIRSQVSPRHAPDVIMQAPDIPTNLNGKKLEVPVKKLLLGMPIDEVANRGAMANPESLDWFVRYAAERAGVAPASIERPRIRSPAFQPPADQVGY